MTAETRPNLELVTNDDHDSIIGIERALIDGLIFDPTQISVIRPLLSPSEFLDPRSSTIYESLTAHPEINDLIGLRDHLEATRQLTMIGGITAFAELGNLETPAGLLPGMAEDIGLAALNRQIRIHARRLANNPALAESLDALTELREQAAGRRERHAIHDLRLNDISFTGDQLNRLLAEDPPEPVYPGIPPQGHFSLLIAPSFSGKTSLALWVAMAQIKGQSPWPGAPVREPGRVLFYSIDEAPTQVVHRIQSLAAKHPAGRFASDYTDRLTIVGPHREIDPDKLNRVKFTDEGLQILRRFVQEAQDQRDPFTDIIIDAYSDVLPDGASDSDNEQATRIGGALEQLAVTYNIAIQVIHHAGKPVVGGDLPDPRDLGRGASALAAKARCIFTCEEEPGLQNVRKIRTRTNLTQSPSPLLLEVAADRSSDGTKIDFFRPHDPVVAYPIDDLITENDGWISITQLARRIGGDAIDPEKKPPGNLLRKARELRGIWDNAGLAEIRTGARNALELRRV